MKTYFKKIDELINDKENCPLPIEIIPNNMGINLSSVDSICWITTDDDQLMQFVINFIPSDIDVI